MEELFWGVAKRIGGDLGDGVVYFGPKCLNDRTAPPYMQKSPFFGLTSPSFV